MIDDNKVIDVYDNLCFGVTYEKHDKIQYTLHKFGEKENILTWYSKINQVNQSKIFGEIKILECPHDRVWPIEILNRSISTTGYIKHLVDWLEAIDI